MHPVCVSSLVANVQVNVWSECLFVQFVQCLSHFHNSFVKVLFIYMLFAECSFDWAAFVQYLCLILSKTQSQAQNVYLFV